MTAHLDQFSNELIVKYESGKLEIADDSEKHSTEQVNM